MKRIINLSLFLFVALMVSVFFVPSVLAAEPTSNDDVDVTLTTAFGFGNTPSTPMTVKYGQEITIEDFGNTDLYEFDFWMVNGVVREDLPQAATFFATDDMELIAVFHPTDGSEFFVAFIDSNGKLIDEGFVVAAEEATAPETAGFTKPGYVVSETTPWVSIKGNQTTASITEASVFRLSYTIDVSKTFNITVPGGTTISNTTPSYNEVVTVEAADENFVAWLEEGQVVSFSPVYTFSALKDRTLTISTEAADDEPVVSLQILTGDDALRTNQTSYLGQVYLPEGTSLIEWGLLVSDLNSMPTYEGDDVEVIKSTVIFPLTNEFLRSRADEDTTTYVRAYAVVTDGVTISTVYSFLEEDETPVELIKLPAPVHGIGHQARPVAHLALGPYEFVEGDNGGFGGHAFKFINNTTLEIFIWERPNHNYKAGSDSFYTEANLLADGIVLTPGNYTIKYYAMGNGTTTSNSDDSIHSVNMTIAAPALAKPVLAIDGTTLTWTAVANATSYEVYIDNVLQVGNASPFDLSSLTEPDVYVLKVIAKASGYQDGQETINYVVENEEALQLEIPDNLSYNSETGFLSWDAIENAVNYTITMDGTTKSTTSTTYDLGLFFVVGTFNVTVIAVGDDINYLDSEESEPLEVTISATLTPLTALVAGDLAGEGGGLVNPHGSNDHRNLVWHGFVTTQKLSGNANGIRITVYAADGVTWLAETVVTGSGTSWYIFGGGFGGTLLAGNIVHLQVNPSAQGIANGYTYSAPLIYTLK